MSSEEILSMDKVSVQTAAKFLGVSVPFIFMGLRTQRLPFGTAVKFNKRWSYYISPGLLVAYKDGTLKIENHIFKEAQQ